MNKSKKTEEELDLEHYVRELGKLRKKVDKAKERVKTLEHDVALFRAIIRHEKNERTRPEEVYMQNVKNTIERNICDLALLLNMVPDAKTEINKQKPTFIKLGSLCDIIANDLLIGDTNVHFVDVSSLDKPKPNFDTTISIDHVNALLHANRIKQTGIKE